jgi:hypothetical protein
MPALPNVNKVIQTTCRHVYGSDLDVITRFFVHFSGANPTSADLGDYCSAVEAGWVTSIAPLCQDSLALTEVAAVDLTTVTGAQGSFPSTESGSRGGTPIPAESAMVVAYKINRRFRGGHPRGYWPFGNDGDIDTPQKWSAGLVASSDAGLSSFFAYVVGAGWSGAGDLKHVNVSYYKGFHVATNPETGRARNVPNPRPTPLTDDVLSYASRTRIGSQRRRSGR